MGQTNVGGEWRVRGRRWHGVGWGEPGETTENDLVKNR